MISFGTTPRERVSKGALDKQSPELMTDKDDGAFLGVEKLAVGVKVVDKANGFVVYAIGGERAWSQEPFGIIFVNETSCVVF